MIASSTAREARLSLRKMEQILSELVMLFELKPYEAGLRSVLWYLRKARLALRQAERHMASFDHEQPELKRLNPQLPRKSEDVPRRLGGRSWKT